jgi:hypothetical protein
MKAKSFKYFEIMTGISIGDTKPIIVGYAHKHATPALKNVEG